MLTPPPELAEDVLVSALHREWPVNVASMTYRPVGFGSHHWEVIDVDDTRWFVTVDELEKKRLTLGEPLDSAFDRLRASLAAARELRDCGRTFVVASVPTRTGEPLARLTERFGVALYPFVDGRSFEWGEFSGPEHGRAIVDLVIGVHTAPAGRSALTDDFAVAHRDELEATLDRPDQVADCGPYARATLLLLADNEEPVRRLLERYDELVPAGDAQTPRMVLTHGEPHPGNTMLTSDGWRFIDWDTAAVAPPERDLWGLDPGDGSVLSAYAEATGVTPAPSMLELYRIRWVLADIAVDVSRFRQPHTGSLDDDKTWRVLRGIIGGLSD